MQITKVPKISFCVTRLIILPDSEKCNQKANETTCIRLHKLRSLTRIQKATLDWLIVGQTSFKESCSCNCSVVRSRNEFCLTCFDDFCFAFSKERPSFNLSSFIYQNICCFTSSVDEYAQRLILYLYGNSFFLCVYTPNRSMPVFTSTTLATFALRAHHKTFNTFSAHAFSKALIWNRILNLYQISD